MEIKSAGFHREMRRLIARTFPRNRLPFFQSLRVRPALAAFQKIKKILGDDERAWHLFLLALHALYEGWHDLPPLSLAERKTLRRDARSLRAIAGRLRERRFAIEVGTESGLLEGLASQLDRFVQPSSERFYNVRVPGGRRLNPREAIPILELAGLFGQRLPGRTFYPVIVDLVNSLPGRRVNCKTQKIKNTLARLAEIGFEPRVQFEFPAAGLVSVRFRSESS